MQFVSIDWRYFSSGLLPALTLRWVLKLQCISFYFNLYIDLTIKLQDLYERPPPLKFLIHAALCFRDRPFPPISFKLIRTRFTSGCVWYKFDYELLKQKEMFIWGVVKSNLLRLFEHFLDLLLPGSIGESLLDEAVLKFLSKLQEILLKF